MREKGLVIEPPCAVCGVPTARIELVPPHGRPRRWPELSEGLRFAFLQYHEPTNWTFIYAGPGGGNGLGDDIDVNRAMQIRRAFREPLRYLSIRGADLHDDAGFCAECGNPYCYEHWNSGGATGYGTCPHGHGKSLDLHWHPPD